MTRLSRGALARSEVAVWMQLRWVLLVYAASSDPAGQGEISILKSAIFWTSRVYNVDLANMKREIHDDLTVSLVKCLHSC